MFWVIEIRGKNMIRDLIWKTFKMEELILDQGDILLLVEIWDIFFKCLWEVAWVEWEVINSILLNQVVILSETKDLLR